MTHELQPLPPDLLSGGRALVAGGTGNVGRWIVDALLRAGATVVVPSRSAERLAQLRAHVSAAAVDRLTTFVGDLGDEAEAERVRDGVLQQVGVPDAVVASLGGFVAAPSVLAAPVDDLRRALDGYLVAHFMVARTLMPVLEARGGSYTFINGLLAFEPRFPGSGLISIATAAQAMLARVLMKEQETGPVRVNELVLYTSFGWGDDEARNAGGVAREDVARAVAYLASDRANDVRGRTIHLTSLDPLRAAVA